MSASSSPRHVLPRLDTCKLNEVQGRKPRSHARHAAHHRAARLTRSLR